MALRRSQRGAILIEFLAVFMPLVLLFVGVWQICEVYAAELVVARASSAAGRAASVVLPDNPAFYNGEPVDSFSGAREADIRRAAGMILAASPHFKNEFEVQVDAIPQLDFGTIQVTVTAKLSCTGLRMLCPFADTMTLHEVSTHAYQGAAYEMEPPDLAFSGRGTTSGNDCGPGLGDGAGGMGNGGGRNSGGNSSGGNSSGGNSSGGNSSGGNSSGGGRSSGGTGSVGDGAGGTGSGGTGSGGTGSGGTGAGGSAGGKPYSGICAGTAPNSRPTTTGLERAVLARGAAPPQSCPYDRTVNSPKPTCKESQQQRASDVADLKRIIDAINQPATSSPSEQECSSNRQALQSAYQAIAACMNVDPQVTSAQKKAEQRLGTVCCQTTPPSVSNGLARTVLARAAGAGSPKPSCSNEACSASQCQSLETQIKSEECERENLEELGDFFGAFDFEPEIEAKSTKIRKDQESAKTCTCPGATGPEPPRAKKSCSKKDKNLECSLHPADYQLNLLLAKCKTEFAGAPNEVFYRVQGGKLPKASKPIIKRSHTTDSGISVDPGVLCVSKNGIEHAQYFAQVRADQTTLPGDGASSAVELFQWEMPGWFSKCVDKLQVPQKCYGANANNLKGLAPKVVDPNQPGDSYEFNPPWYAAFEQYAVPGSLYICGYTPDAGAGP